MQITVVFSVINQTIYWHHPKPWMHIILLLRWYLSVLSYYLIQGSSTLNEQMVLLLPTAVYALCTGYAPFTQCFKEFPLLYSSLDITEALDDCHKVEFIHSCI